MTAGIQHCWASQQWHPSPWWRRRIDYVAQAAEFCGQPESITSAATRRAISAAHPQKISLRELLQLLAARQGNRPTFLPIPWRLMYAGLKSLETLGLPAPFRSDSLIGIVFQNPAPQFDLPEIPRVTFRPFV